jgi:hypothetical protein
VIHALVYSQDPGGANVLAPVARALLADPQGAHFTVRVHPLSAAVFERAGVPAVPVETEVGVLPASDAALDGWLDTVGPTHVVLTASSLLVDLTNARLLTAARRRGLPTLTFLDHWVGLDRFLDADGRPVYLPDVVGCIDEACRARVAALGPVEAVVVGQPHLEAVAERVSHSAAGQRAAPRVVMVSQPVVQDGTMTGAFFRRDAAGTPLMAHLIHAVRAAAPDAVLSYRPHPKERASEPLPSDVVHDRGAGGAAVLDRFDVFVGLTSMLLFEAAAAGRQVVQLELPEFGAMASSEYPPYALGARVTSPAGIASAVSTAVAAWRAGAANDALAPLQLAGSLDRSVALVRAFLRSVHAP